MKLQAIAHQNVDFYGTSIPTAQVNNQVFVAMRPIVEGMGLNWSAQQQKLSKNRSKFSCMDINTTGADGKQYSMLHILLRKLNGWLFSINPEKVKPEIKEKVIRYQEECFQVLHDYWRHGFASRENICQTAEEKANFYDAVRDASGAYTFEEAGQILDLGRNTLFEILRENKILMVGENWNLPYQSYVDRGYFFVEPKTVESEEEDWVSHRVLVTPKGLIWIQKQLSKKKFTFQKPAEEEPEEIDPVTEEFGPEFAEVFYRFEETVNEYNSNPNNATEINRLKTELEITNFILAKFLSGEWDKPEEDDLGWREEYIRQNLERRRRIRKGLDGINSCQYAN